VAWLSLAHRLVHKTDDMPTSPSALTILDVLNGYREGWRPTEFIHALLERAASSDDPAIWICLQGEKRLLERASELEAIWDAHGNNAPADMPLFGVPFAVKDNIDAAGLRTTVGCPAFAFAPTESAAAVRRLEVAGAILIGKTNLDQFATGLVGTRSPYGVVRNPFNSEYISGGSSSGSAAAVARGLVAFSIGTDTAGSGRIPAGFCNLVGLKPSRGLVSNRGVFPACRSLDCVSIFALDITDAWTVLGIIVGEDAQDTFSRAVPQFGPLTRGARVGIPRALEFFGDALAAEAFENALAALGSSRHVDQIASVDFDPFREAGQLLYNGAWVAERRAALGEFFSRSEAMDASVHQVIANADRYSAVDACNDAYRLAELRRLADAAFRGIDVLLVPTAPTIYRIDEIQQAPIALNSKLGYYTSFVNLLDLCALALPAGFRGDGLPFGITLIAPAGHDHRLAELARAIEPLLHRRLATGSARPLASSPLAPLPTSEATTRVAVVGAHLSGQPLNWQLVERSARLIATTTTAPEYRLYALPGSAPAKPALVRSLEKGRQIEIEVWEMPTRHFGSFVAAVPSPLGIGSLRTADGEEVKGFICEPWAIAGAEEITTHGGWRAYLAACRETTQQ
jgi:allophanate hydrolase